jgi:hypothetical protein
MKCRGTFEEKSMKYFFIALGVIALIVITYFKGFAAGTRQSDEVVSPCLAESILAADNPDLRISHCRDQDWDGSTLLKDRLAEAASHPTEYGILCQAPELSLPMPLIQPAADKRLPHLEPVHK